MRHYKKGRKLGTDASHTKAMKKNLAVALFTNDRIKTTVTRAKEVRGTIDRIITWAKKGDLHSRRLAIAALGDKELVREVFEKAEQGMWADRNGGYTRILKLGPRKGDNAPMAILELVEEAVTPKAKADEKPAKGKKSAAKKATKSEDKAADEVEDLIEEGIEDKNDNDKDDIEEFAEARQIASTPTPRLMCARTPSRPKKPRTRSPSRTPFSRPRRQRWPRPRQRTSRRSRKRSPRRSASSSTMSTPCPRKSMPSRMLTRRPRSTRMTSRNLVSHREHR